MPGYHDAKRTFRSAGQSFRPVGCVGLLQASLRLTTLPTRGRRFANAILQFGKIR
jgi:hypothetical protein